MRLSGYTPSSAPNIGATQTKGTTTIISTPPRAFERILSVPGGTGPKGDDGEDGNDGPPNSLSIGTVTSGPEAAATLTGTAPNQELNLVLPRGQDGKDGEGEPGPPGTTDYDDLTNVPTTFPPSPHTHEIAEVNGLQPALNGKAPKLTGTSVIAGVNASGVDTAFPYSSSTAAANSVVVRTSTGAVVVGTPTANEHAAPRSYVDDKVAGIVSSAPATLDTLDELANALGDDPNFATTVSTNIGLRALKATKVQAGTGLTGGGDLSADRTLAVVFGTTAGTVCQGNDTRLSDARTPTAHTHPVSQIQATGTPANTTYLRGDGVWATPASASTASAAASVATSEGTSSSTYTDLTTTTDKVDVVVGASGTLLINFAANMTHSAANGYARMTFALSGANTLAADDANSVAFKNPVSGGSGFRLSGAKLLTGLNPGSTTVKLKYSGGSGTATFSLRDISAVAL